MQAESVYASENICLFILADHFPDFEKWVPRSDLRLATTPPDAEPGTQAAKICDAWLGLRRLSEGDRMALALRIDRHNATRIASIPRLSAYLKSWEDPEATADFGLWCAMPLLTRDEAVALLLGKDPHKVTWESVRHDVDVWPFASKFRDLRTVMKRACRAGQLEEPITPRKLVAWARRRNLVVPAKLSDGVLAASSTSAEEKHHAHPKEKLSLLQLFHILIMEFLHHVPGRNSTTSQLLRLLEKYGLRMDEKTVRKFVKQSDELRPPRD